MSTRRRVLHHPVAYRHHRAVSTTISSRKQLDDRRPTMQAAPTVRPQQASAPPATGIRRDLTPLARWFFLGADRLDCVRIVLPRPQAPARRTAFTGVVRLALLITRACACAGGRAAACPLRTHPRLGPASDERPEGVGGASRAREAPEESRFRVRLCPLTREGSERIRALHVSRVLGFFVVPLSLSAEQLRRVTTDVFGNRFAYRVADSNCAGVVHPAPDPCVVPVGASL